MEVEVEAEVVLKEAKGNSEAEASHVPSKTITKALETVV